MRGDESCGSKRAVFDLNAEFAPATAPPRTDLRSSSAVLKVDLTSYSPGPGPASLAIGRLRALTEDDVREPSRVGHPPTAHSSPRGALEPNADEDARSGVRRGDSGRALRGELESASRCSR
eukprot:scaffold85360_cov23-Tisochrysis_lutea.AAC.2